MDNSNNSLYNFGKIKNAFDELMVEGIMEKNDIKKDIFAKYIKTIRNNKILNAQYHVYKNIEALKESDIFKLNEHIKNNINILKEFNKADILKENKKIVKLLSSVNKYKNKLNLKYNKKDMLLHETISNIISLTSKPSNINVITENILNIVEQRKIIEECSCNNNNNNIDNEVIKFDDNNLIPSKILAGVCVKNFNDEYKDKLTEEEKSVLKSMIEGNNNDKKVLQQQYINQCIKIIDEKYEDNNSDLNEKNILLKTKNKLLNIRFNSDNYINEMTKILTLKNDLTDNNSDDNNNLIIK